MKKFNKISIKLIIIITMIVTLVSSISSVIFFVENSKRLRDNLNDFLENIKNITDLSLGYQLWEYDYEGVKKVNEAILKNEIIIAINILTIDKQFEFGAVKTISHNKTILIDEISEAFQLSSSGRHVKKITFDVFYKERNVGFVEVFYSEKKIIESERNVVYGLIGIFSAIAIFIIIAIYLLLNKLVIHPLLFLTEFSKKIASQKDYSVRINKTSNDEFSVLYKGFNNMLEEIYKRDKEINKTMNYLDNVLNSLHSAIISIDLKGNIVRINDKAREFIGLNDNEILNKSIWKIIPQIDIFNDYFTEIIQKKHLHYSQKVNVLKIGSKLYNIYFIPLISDDLNGIVIRLDDITDIVKKDEQLIQVQKMETIGTLAGGLAHDFNNVLGGITGSTSILHYKLQKENAVSIPDLKSVLTTIENSAARATDMVQQLLTLSRKHELNLVPVDLNAAVKHVIKICQNTFDKCIDIKVKYHPHPAIVKADPAQIEQVLLNLCLNSCHAMTIMRKKADKPGGILEIFIDKLFADNIFNSTHPQAEAIEYWVLSVKDTGVGMDNQTKIKIFEPFFTTKKAGKGTGLGLAMVYNIISQHNGFIDVYSEQGIGTSINLYLPLSKDHLAKEEEQKEIQIWKGEGRILVVDDEFVMRQIAKSILEECGYEIDLAENGYEAIALYEQHKKEYAVVVLDMAMPKLSGKETYLKLKQINPDIITIVASGLLNDERIEELSKLGINGFIKKPYNISRLSKIVSEALSK
ncbi:MAG: response regulator [Clostridia bacterium]|nr:response regulator [Clostridia bacterium]